MKNEYITKEFLRVEKIIDKCEKQAKKEFSKWLNIKKVDDTMIRRSIVIGFEAGLKSQNLKTNKQETKKRWKNN